MTCCKESKPMDVWKALTKRKEWFYEDVLEDMDGEISNCKSEMLNRMDDYVSEDYADLTDDALERLIDWMTDERDEIMQKLMFLKETEK